MGNIIEVIQPEAVLNVSRLEKSDPVSDVFAGNILYNGEVNQVYLKAYAFGGETISKGDRGLLNEIVGYLICRHYRVPQPSQAFLVLVNKLSVNDLLPRATKRLRDSFDQSLIVPMFATNRMMGKSLSTLYHHNLERVVPILLRWRYRNAAIICDEMMANTDRYPRNILTLNGKDFHLIDNGKLAVEDLDRTNWRNIDLKPSRNYINYLADLDKSDIQADRRKGSNLIHEALQLCRPIHALLAECRFWIDQLAHEDDKSDWYQFLEFIESRNQAMVELLNQRYGMLL